MRLPLYLMNSKCELTPNYTLTLYKVNLLLFWFLSLLFKIIMKSGYWLFQIT